MFAGSLITMTVMVTSVGQCSIQIEIQSLTLLSVGVINNLVTECSDWVSTLDEVQNTLTLVLQSAYYTNYALDPLQEFSSFRVEFLPFLMSGFIVFTFLLHSSMTNARGASGSGTSLCFDGL